ncbi:glycine cleavage T C-terminal barrel domain-containing protein [Embleya sp. NPDC059267]|uniref:glycine cleavage T C-terminal barrel domain-containing protein n=1 Tax=Embleya sp. NPDC059267 TaxID=3346798 RepID=UPI0036C27B43
MPATPIRTVTIGHAVVPWTYTDDEREYHALRHEAALFDLNSTGLIALPTAGAQALLRAVVPGDLGSVFPGQSATSLLLDPEGHPLDTVTVYRLRDRWLIETAFGRGPDTLAHLISAGAALDGGGGGAVEPVDVRTEFSTLGLEGPFAWRVLRELLGDGVTSVPLGGIVHRTWRDAPVLVARSGYTGEYGYKVFVPPALADDLFDAAVAKSAVPAGYRTLEAAMLEVRQPLPHREVGPGDTVLGCGYNWLVDLDQPDFIGRDAVLAEFKTGPAVRTVGLTMPRGVELPEHAEVSVAGLTIGRLIHHADSPGLACTLALARIAPEWAASGFDWEVAGANGPIPARSVSSPYLVPLSWSTSIA